MSPRNTRSSLRGKRARDDDEGKACAQTLSESCVVVVVVVLSYRCLLKSFKIYTARPAAAEFQSDSETHFSFLFFSFLFLSFSYNEI